MNKFLPDNKVDIKSASKRMNSISTGMEVGQYNGRVRNARFARLQ